MRSLLALAVAFSLLAQAGLSAQEPAASFRSRGNIMLDRYFQRETETLASQTRERFASLEDWQTNRETYRLQLMEMLGLSPLPEKSPLQPTITHVEHHEDWLVESLHFQSSPGLYVTANLYRPREVIKPLPAILYLCGHGKEKKDGVSYGNKVHYQHHGEWFARHGFVCLTIDTLQLGEIEGVHHGTYRLNMWWWFNRGYTPAGVEAWNSIRALDYLQSRPEVDAERIGATGRSGGGAYTWWIAALDERIKCAAPVAGITDLENYVVDDCIEGHCDCMFFVNTYRWDYPMVAVLVAPRPLLICNTDSDSIFPLDGVMRVHSQVRTLYELYGKPENLGVAITPGPHQDTQELRTPAFRWLTYHLQNSDALLESPATPFFEASDLQVFQGTFSERLPTDARNANIEEDFVPAADQWPDLTTQQELAEAREHTETFLSEQVFAGWPQAPLPSPALTLVRDVTRSGIRLREFGIDTQAGCPLPLYVVEPVEDNGSDGISVQFLDEASSSQLAQALESSFPKVIPLRSDTSAQEDDKKLAISSISDDYRISFGSIDRPMLYFAPRGIGPTRWQADTRQEIHIRRRFYLLGQTLGGMQTWDCRQVLNSISSIPGLDQLQLQVTGYEGVSVQTLYACLIGQPPATVTLLDLPVDHRSGPPLLNISKGMQLENSLALLVDSTSTKLVYSHKRKTTPSWDYVVQATKLLDWPSDRFSIFKLNGTTEKNKD